MNALWFLRRQPSPIPHVVPKYDAATKQESAAVRTRKRDIELELGLYVALTPVDRRKAETEAAISVLRSRAAASGRRVE